jgi:hypothetical protein
MAGKIKLYVVWGRCDRQKKTYTFNTVDEKKAFMHGADEAQGWEDLAFFDSLKERNEYYKEVEEE